MLEAAMRKLLCLQLRPIFAPKKPCFFHIATLANPRSLFRYLKKSLNKVLIPFAAKGVINDPPEENQSEKAIGATLSLRVIRKRLADSKVIVLSYFWPSLTNFVLKGRKGWHLIIVSQITLRHGGMEIRYCYDNGVKSPSQLENTSDTSDRFFTQ